jgi:hypothetical protein
MMGQNHGQPGACHPSFCQPIILPTHHFAIPIILPTHHFANPMRPGREGKTMMGQTGQNHDGAKP